MNLEKLFEVYEFSKNAHKGQKDKLGKDFIFHPIAVANLAKKYCADESTIYACLLHDVLEDTPVSLQEIKKRFGKEISYLVDGVTKENTFKKTIEKVNNYSKKDKRVILIKMLDRIHNLNRAINPEKRDEILINVVKYLITTKAYISLGNKYDYFEVAWELKNQLNKFSLVVGNVGR